MVYHGICPTASEFKHQNWICSGNFADEFRAKRPREETKLALVTLEEATEAYIVKVIAQSHY